MGRNSEAKETNMIYRTSDKSIVEVRVKPCQFVKYRPLIETSFNQWRLLGSFVFNVMLATRADTANETALQA